MSGLRDYQQWHHEYDDPGSDLSWRLQTVQHQQDRRPIDHRAWGQRRVSRKWTTRRAWTASGTGPGLMRYEGKPRELVSGRRLFTFVR